MKKLLFVFLVLLGFQVNQANAANSVTFQFDLPPDATNIVKYHLYGRTNGLTDLNYAKIATVNHPTNIVTVILPVGVSQTFYATSEDKYFIESIETSNLVDYFSPVSVPPSLSPVININAYNAKTWFGVNLTWIASPTNYMTTNYAVYFEMKSGNLLITNKFNTITPSYSLSSLAVSDYRIWVEAQNIAGSSLVPANSIIYLYEKNNKHPMNLIIK